jgi:serine protease
MHPRPLLAALLLCCALLAAPARAHAAAPVVAVIDSGADLSHRALAGTLWRNPGETAGNGVDDDANGFIDDVHGADFVGHDGEPADGNGHGTHGACLVARAGAPRTRSAARLMILRVLNRRNAGPSAALASALDYAAAHGARIINLSVAYYGEDPAVRAALDRAAAAGALVVTAAGNKHENLDRVSVFPASYRSPSMLVVAASAGARLAPWSAFGARAVDLAAPGESVRSCLPRGRYGLKSGTSQAAGMASNAAARLLASRPAATAADLQDALRAATAPVRRTAGSLVAGVLRTAGLPRG